MLTGASQDNLRARRENISILRNIIKEICIDRDEELIRERTIEEMERKFGYTRRTAREMFDLIIKEFDLETWTNLKEETLYFQAGTIEEFLEWKKQRNKPKDSQSVLKTA